MSNSDQEIQLSGTLFLGSLVLPYSGTGKVDNGELTIHAGNYGSPEENAGAVLELARMFQAAFPKTKTVDLKAAARAKATETATPVPVPSVLGGIVSPALPDASPVTVVVPLEEDKAAATVEVPQSEFTFAAPPTEAAPVPERKRPGRKPGTKNKPKADAQ